MSPSGDSVADTVSVGGKPVKKTTLYAGGALGVLVIGYAIYQRRKTAAPAGAATGMVTDPAGNTCSALDPGSGYCPGTAGDQAYYQQQAGGGLSALGYGGGGASVGGYAYPVTPGSGIPTPGSVVPTFTDNASWMQYAEAYLVQNEGDDAATLGNALGKYLAGAQVTAAQQQLIEQAIAAANKPPVSGPDGFPPSIRLAAAGGPAPPPGGTLPAPAGLSVTPYTGYADFGWATVAGAKSYELLIAGAGGQGTGTSHVDVTVTGNHAGHVTLARGAYRARVRAAGGHWTADKPFTVK